MQVNVVKVRCDMRRVSQNQLFSIDKYKKKAHLKALWFSLQKVSIN